jgi:putative membrane protein
LASRPQKILILNVDRDDDLGQKAGISTPVVGRDKCLEAGVRLMLVDPEEADANAICAAVSEFDKLRDRGYECEVALLSGTPAGDFDSDQKMLKQARSVISAINPEGIVLVSDGFEDERVLPLIQNLAPVVSLKRVVIKHSASVEESYQVLGRYLKMLIYEPRYSKFFLGIPGVLLVLYGLFAYLKLYADFAYIFALVLGGMFVVKGFGVDSMLTRARRRTFFLARFFAFLASLIIDVVAVLQGYTAITSLVIWPIAQNNASIFYSNLGLIAGTFIQKSALLFWVGIATNIAVDAVYHGLRRSAKIARDLIALAALVLMYTPVLALAALFENPSRSAIPIVSLLLAGLAVILVLVYLTYEFLSSRRVSAHAKE